MSVPASRWRGGCTAGATTAGSCSSTCAIAAASYRSWCTPSRAPAAHALAAQARNEFVLLVEGSVEARSAATVNPNLATGEVEVAASRLEILNPAKTPPFPVNEPAEVDEHTRLKYRYIDLRRPAMYQNLLRRHQMNRFIREFMSERDFLEVETPALVAATPEGARDYLVPSRLHPGSFYALPQSPQQLKQLLMVAGVERYFQIVRCFRDEDLRADRQPEFTQLDVELSFGSEDDVLAMMEELFTALVPAIRPDLRLVSPFPRLTYAEAMERFGSDKPDLRYGLELADCTDLARDSSFAVFRDAVEGGRPAPRGGDARRCGALSAGGGRLHGARQDLGGQGAGFDSVRRGSGRRWRSGDPIACAAPPHRGDGQTHRRALRRADGRSRASGRRRGSERERGPGRPAP